MTMTADPRVLFAAERTLLAWNRSSLALIGFGFLIERFGLFLHMLNRTAASLSVPVPVTSATSAQAGGSAWLGLAFALLGSVFALLSALQFRRSLRTVHPADIPPGYWVHLGTVCNIAVGVLGLVMAAYLVRLR